MTSSGTSAASLISAPHSIDSNPNPPPPENSSSFGQVMQQHGGDSSSNDSKSATNSDKQPDSSPANSSSTAEDDSTTTATPPKAGGGGKSAHGKKPDAVKAPPVVIGTLKSMLVRASVLASSDASAATAAATKAKAPADAPTQSELDGANLSALIAQALALASNPKPVTTTAPATKTKAGDAAANKDDAKETSSPSNNATDLSTLMAQASLLALSGPTTAGSTSGKDVSSSGTGKAIAGSSGKEKKSASSSTEGSFLQSGTSAAGTTSSLLASLGLAAQGLGQASSAQTVTTDAGAKKSTGDLLAKVGNNLAGTANVEKEKTMNADQNLPALLSGDAPTTGLSQTPSDLQIKLSSNSDFDHALKTVLHVASLNEISQSRTATRVAIELQTPPGAVVNVYVTKSDNQWRAQLSTSDPAALAWVQDKISSLKTSTETGVDVHWLPPQMEAAATSSGSDSNLGWDRGGQNPSQYQQDENRPSRQEDPDEDSELATAGANFMESLVTSGRSA